MRSAIQLPMIIFRLDLMNIWDQKEGRKRAFPYGNRQGERDDIMNARTGFTLIEILIVVAIIAILALIAVPNFLEAQTRAKVSRVRTDLRSLATGQEAYMVDWNSYTTGDHARPNGRLEGWQQLTTPVAYVTSLPTDPFGDSKYQDLTTWVGPALYELGTGVPGVGPSGTPDSPREGFPSSTWEMNSSGPDKRENTSGPGHNPGAIWTWADATANGYPWVHIPPDDPRAVAELLSLLYDPTNGTISRGEIFRAGGTKPPGEMFNYLYGAGSGQ